MSARVSKPWPYTLAAGERLSHPPPPPSPPPPKVTLSVDGDLPKGSGRLGAGDRHARQRGRRPVPAIGLAADPLAATGNHAGRHRRGGPAGIPGCRFDPGEGHDARTLTGFRALAEALDCEVWLEMVVPCPGRVRRPTDDPAVLARDLDGIAEAVRAADLTPLPAWSPAGRLPQFLPARRRLAGGAAPGGGLRGNPPALPPARASSAACTATSPS